MYTIKQAARLTGVPESSLRAWERRYAVVVPVRNASGYRVYDQQALATISTMRRLVDEGWSPAEAATAVRDGSVPVTVQPTPGVAVPEAVAAAAPTATASPTAGATPDTQPRSTEPEAITCMRRFLRAAVEIDVASLEESLDVGFALGSFEHVIDSWLFPTLEALGEAWARGEVDVAGEHAASHAVHRRLSAAFDAAGSTSRGPAVVVGLPSGSQHELGALAFATAVRRRGLDVLYLGANVPLSSWETAVRSHAAQAVVLAVVTDADRASAGAVATRLAACRPAPLVCAGGASAAGMASGVRVLSPSIAWSAQEIDDLLHPATDG